MAYENKWTTFVQQKRPCDGVKTDIWKGCLRTKKENNGPTSFDMINDYGDNNNNNSNHNNNSNINREV